MKSGYDQFFKKARQVAKTTEPTLRRPERRFELNDRKVAAKQPASMSADELAIQLRSRLKQKKKAKKKAGIPWKLAGFSFLGLMIAAAGTFEHERIEKFLRRVEVSFIGSAGAEEAPKVQAKSDQKGKETEKKEEKAEVKKEFTQEELNHFAKLNERKRELDAREEELNRMESELAVQRSALEKRMENLEKTRSEISSVLDDRVKADDKKIATLVDTYSNMKPQQAAKVFEEMDEDLAVEVIGRMKKKNAAEIMNLLKPEKAKAFTEKFAGYKRSSASSN